MVSLRSTEYPFLRMKIIKLTCFQNKIFNPFLIEKNVLSNSPFVVIRSESDIFILFDDFSQYLHMH